MAAPKDDIVEQVLREGVSQAIWALVFSAVITLILATVTQCSYWSETQGFFPRRSRWDIPPFSSTFGAIYPWIAVPLTLFWTVVTAKDEYKKQRSNQRYAAEQKAAAARAAARQAAEKAAQAVAQAARQEQMQREELQRKVAGAQSGLLYAWIDFQARQSFMGEVPMDRLAADFRASLPALIPAENLTLLRFSATSQAVRDLLGMQPPMKAIAAAKPKEAAPLQPIS